MYKYFLLSAALCSSLLGAAELPRTAPSRERGHALSSAGPSVTSGSTQLSRSSTLASTSSNTYTYLRCYYRTGTALKPTSNYVWALDPANGDYYRVYGYWWSGGVFDWKNMFYSDVSQASLKSVCQSTLAGKGIGKPVEMWAAADNALSFNYTVWSIDGATPPAGVNKIIAFGDSLSDTQNMYNASNWTLPNRNSWFLGRFSNGNNWVEYLAGNLRLPIYNWAVGGAGVNTEQYVISGVTDQVNSYLQYMQKAPNYRPENSLFTVLIGGNDFVNYNRTVDEVIRGETAALQSLIGAGARNILLLKLPDVSRAPVYTSGLKSGAGAVAAKVVDFNNRLAELVGSLRSQWGPSLHISLFDTHSLFNDLLNNPAKYGVSNTSQSCLNINSDSTSNYLASHSPRSICTNPDSFVFWDTLHPTTHTHKLLGDSVSSSVSSNFTVSAP